MKFKLTLIFCIVFTGFSLAQEFTFQINFTDAIGNKDSLIIGYDIIGTDGIDPTFGEVNIISIPKDTILDVRISDVYTNLSQTSTSGTLQLKKQITENSLSCNFSLYAIEIYAKYWPITASWDSSLFNNSCLNGSIFTSIHPGGWWDVGSTSDLLRKELAMSSAVTFTSNNSGNLLAPGIIYDSGAYLDASNDSVSVFWLKMNDLSILNSYLKNEKLINEVKVFPNPTNTKLNILIEKNINLKKPTVSILDVSGRNVLKEVLSFSNQFNVDFLTNGVYILHIQLNDKIQIYKKVIINN